MLRIALFAAIGLGTLLALLALSGGARRAALPVGDGAKRAASEDRLRPLASLAPQRVEAEPAPVLGDSIRPATTFLAEGPGRRRAAGRVLDLAGRPARAELLLVRPGGAQQRGFLKNRGRLFETGPDGSFFFECDSRGEFDLLAIDNSTGWVRVPLGADAWPTDMEIRLDPLPYVRGRVVGPDGTPRVAVAIELVPEEAGGSAPTNDDLPPDLRRKRHRNQRPDAEGRFAIGPLAPGEYRLIVETDFSWDFGRWDSGRTASTDAEEIPAPTTLLVRADSDAEREVLVRHNSTELWIRWFDPGSADGSLVLNRWQHEAFESGRGKLSNERSRHLEYQIVSNRGWPPGGIALENPADDRSAILAVAVQPESTLTVHGIGPDVPLLTTTVPAPFAGQRHVIDIVVPARARAVPVELTTVYPDGARRTSIATELRRRGDRDGPGLPLRWNSGKPFDLVEGHYTLHLTSKFKLASGELETVEREVDLDLHGRSEFRATVDLRP